MTNRKAFGPVIAVALLIVVTVASVVGFQVFYGEYQSSIQAKTEVSSEGNILSIDFVQVNPTTTSIFVKNDGRTHSFINELKIDSETCALTGSDVAGDKTVTQIDTDCIVVRGQRVEVVLITEFGVFQETHVAR